MSLLPLPSTFSGLLDPSSPANRSLVFDRGMDRYQDGRTFGIPAGGKEAFLQAFCGEYRQDRRGHFDHFVARRSAALEGAGAEPIEMTTHARLVIGLGLPHPIETGFLFDRLSGSVYLPGSSVKGMMRAAARLVSEGELDGDSGFWTRESLDRLFGPPIEPGTLPRTGSLRFYDAFPVRWPRLEVDVLTPHFARYYGGEAVPADWESPTPVPFLTVAEGQVFRFHIGSSDGERWKDDWKQIETLLATALEWLGIGGKTSSGYGQLKAGDLPERPKPMPVEDAREAQKKSPPLSNVLLKIDRGTATAFRKNEPVASCRPDELDPELLEVLKKSRKGVRADVEVVKAGSSARIVGVPRWEIVK